MPDPQKFANTVVQHLPFLKRIVQRLTRDVQITDDIVQNTILKALAHGEQFRFESTLRTWLGSIAINEVRSVYRSAWHRRAVPLTPETIEVKWRSRAALPNEVYEQAERDLLLRKAVSDLPPSERVVVELCDLQCVSMKEAASRLGLTLPAVKTRLHRARRRLGTRSEHFRQLV